MSNNILLQPAYILHSRLYRDTSLLLDLFTEEHGRVSAVARGVRGARSRSKGLLQPFVPLLISWYGKTELMSLSVAEANGVAHALSGEALLCGLYLNELLVRLLHRYDPHPQLYQAYQEALLALAKDENEQPILRRFEKRLLTELGYALQLDREAHNGLPIELTQFYYFEPAQGLLPYADGLRVNSRNVFCGESLLALHADQLTESEFLRDAKRLLRIALGHLLDGKPLRSRELFLR